jgi:hypothetical protein
MPLIGITFFPIYGLTIGINYIDSTLQGEEVVDQEEHVIQFLLLFFGFNIFWFTDIEQK